MQAPPPLAGSPQDKGINSEARDTFPPSRGVPTGPPNHLPSRNHRWQGHGGAQHATQISQPPREPLGQSLPGVRGPRRPGRRLAAGESEAAAGAHGPSDPQVLVPKGASSQAPGPRKDEHPRRYDSTVVPSCLGKSGNGRAFEDGDTCAGGASPHVAVFPSARAGVRVLSAETPFVLLRSLMIWAWSSLC